MKLPFFLLSAILLLPEGARAATVEYTLEAQLKKVNFSGRKEVDFAIALNGSIPAPTLEFTEGDEAVIRVTNRIPDQELSIHWHGILLPPLMDGVPYLTTPPIRPGETFTFRFPVRQHGTYWYHSHTGLQEQKGVFGPIVIHPDKPVIKADKEVVVVLSDWSDENADSILKHLKKDGDFYAYKKGTVRSWLGAVQAGGLGAYLKNEWNRMGGMDLSDVGYDAFLINGRRSSQLLMAHPGQRIRLRIINAAASSYFYVSLGNLPLRVISADGTDISPVWTKELLLGMAETADVLLELPEHKNYELRATAQDVTGFASGWIGMGEKVPAPDKPFPDLYAPMDHGSMGHGGMDHSSHGSTGQSGHSGHSATKTADPSSRTRMDHSDHKSMDHSAHGSPAASGPGEGEEVLPQLTVDQMESPAPTAFPAARPRHDVKLVLGGDMERYVWHINGKAIHQEMNININEGDVVRFTLVNETMMHHPMHLHGHFFRVLNRAGENSPLKHTVDVPPMGTRTIEFLADEPGQWMLHCHNLYHLKSGMARVVNYSSFIPSREMAHYQKHDPHRHDHWYFAGQLSAATNQGRVDLRASQTWNQIETRLEARRGGKSVSLKGEWEKEGDLFYRRWVSRYFSLIGGATVFDHKERATAGIAYTLPFLLETNVLIDHKGKFRIDLEKRFQWTGTILSDVELRWRPDQEGTSLEAEATLMYAPSWSWAAGLVLTDENLGIGALWKF